jgi:hypothetical protein
MVADDGINKKKNAKRPNNPWTNSFDTTGRHVI